MSLKILLLLFTFLFILIFSGGYVGIFIEFLSLSFLVKKCLLVILNGHLGIAEWKGLLDDGSCFFLMPCSCSCLTKVEYAGSVEVNSVFENQSTNSWIQ